MAEKDNIEIETSEQCVIELECTTDSHPFETRTLTVVAGRDVLIGRFHKKQARANQEDANLLFHTRILSQSHAILFLRDGNLYLKDLCSSNGTFLNGEHIGLEIDDMNELKARALKTGDILRFGKLRAFPTHGDVVKPIEAKLTILYPASTGELNEHPKENSKFTPYEGRQLDQTILMEQHHKKKPFASPVNKVVKRNAQTKSVNLIERGMETESVNSCTTSTQILPDELKKQTQCDTCETISEEFYRYRKLALVTITICLLIIIFYQC